jgi:hypothetical protein
VSPVLIRFARRKSNWEDDSLSVEELQQREFKAKNGGPDLTPSVYEIAEVHADLVRVYAEHAYQLDPPKTALALDVKGAEPGQIRQTAGATPFRFTRDHHREVVLPDRAALIDFIKAAMQAPRHDVGKQEVYAYVRERLRQGDSEWTPAAKSSGAKRWIGDLVAK